MGSGAYPVFADINLDGLQDLIIGNYGFYKSSWYDASMALHSDYAGRMAVFFNVGEADNPVFDIVTDNFGHINEMNILGPYPAFGDIDSDDDADMIVGRDDGTLMFYRNCSCLGNPEDFDLELVNYQGIDVGDFSTPFIFDIDEDGLLDLIIGERNGNLNYYKNTGDKYEPVFTFVTDSLGKVDVTDYNLSWDGYSTPYMFRAADGKMRLISGSEQGVIYCYTDIEGSLTDEFTPSDELWMEVDSVNFDIGRGYRTSAAMANLNGDAYLDLMTGNFSGGLCLYSTMNNPEVSMDIADISIRENLSLHIFPNPAGNVVNINAEQSSGPVDIKVFNMLGYNLASYTNVSMPFTMPVSELPEGIYLISVAGNNVRPASARLLIRH